MGEYRVIRSKRKTMCLEVTEKLEVLVRVPQWVSGQEIEQFVDKHSTWIADKLDGRRLNAQRFPPPTEQELVRLTSLAREVLPGRVEYYGGLMRLWPTGLKITRAKTRFGSCSGKNSICFSCLLMRYPMEAVDYVVVHELAHIRHKNHGPQFYETIAAVMPDYKARRALLRL